MIERKQEQQDEGSNGLNLMSPQKSQQKLLSSQVSYSSPTQKKERVHPQLPPKSAGGERKSPFKAAIKLLVSPVKLFVSPVKNVRKASGMLSDSFHDFNSSRVYEKDVEEDEEENDLILLCRELELLSD